MPIITISRGSRSYGKETAEKVAKKLGYECVSREIFLEASEQFHVPEIKLIRAIHDSPSILGRFTHGKEAYIAYIRSALLKHVLKNNTVYHGFAGHVFLEGISHVLKVRIMADLDKRIQIVMKRDGIGEKKALQVLTKDDEERQRWASRLYGIDTQDPKLYDMMLHIGKLTVDDAVDIIAAAAQSPSLKQTVESHQKLVNLTLAARIEAELVDVYPGVQVTSKNGDAQILVKAPLKEAHHISALIKERLANMPEVKSIDVKVKPYVLDINF